MRRILFRLWLVGVLIWWGYNLFVYRGILDSFGKRDWLQAIQYGVNNFLCEFKIASLCTSVSVSFFKRTEVNETFMLAAIFVGVPLAVLIVLSIVSWIVGGKSRS